MDLSNEFLPEEAEQEQEGWTIKSDLEADWALDKIREEQADCRRFEMVVNEKVAQLQAALTKKKDQAERSTEFFTVKLQDYFKTVPHKATKTQETYSLPSGKLVLKHQKPEFLRDEDTLLKWVEQNSPELVKVKKSTNWEELKKSIIISGNSAITEDGEAIPGIIVQNKPDEFKVVVE